MAGPHSRANEMRCIECGSEAVTERSERTAQGYRRFRCRRCGKQFNERTGGRLNRTRYPSDVIALVVLWRLRYELGLRDLPEMFAVRGIVFSREALVQRVWGEDTHITVRSVDTLVKRLRRRIEADAGDPRYLLTVWGVGYKFADV